MYENYGGKRPEIPEGWEEVAYRVPKKDEPFISSEGRGVIRWYQSNHFENRVIVRRKPDIDPALVAPAGYQFRLDEYGRPVCRAPKRDEWYLAWDGAQAWPATTGSWPWAECHYILDPIPKPPKMTIVEAKHEAILQGKKYVRTADLSRVWHIDSITDDFWKRIWEVVP